MSKHRSLKALVAAAAVALAASGCTHADNGTPAAGNTQAANGAFALDTSRCPSDATKALAPGEALKVGTVWPLSGPYAVIGAPIVEGMKIAFAKTNAAGGVGGHQLELVAKDDGYDPTKTLPQVTELLQQDKVFATLGQGGTPNVAAVQPLAEQTCTPQLWVGSGAAQYGDPAAHPWTISGFMSYTTEAQIWADYLKRDQPSAKVAYISIDNEGGKAYAASFKAAADSLGLTVVASEKTSPTAATVENEVTHILAAQPDAVIVMSVGASCAKVMGALAVGGYKGTTIAAYTCAGPTIFPALGPAANGAMAVTINKGVDDSDAEIQQFKADVATYGNGAKAGDDVLTGYRLGDLFVKNAKAAAGLDGGLTRANLMNAAWSLDDTWFAAWGGKARVDGAKDSYVLETGRMVKWDAASGRLLPVGDPIDREGKTGTYEG